MDNFKEFIVTNIFLMMEKTYFLAELPFKKKLQFFRIGFTVIICVGFACIVSAQKVTDHRAIITSFFKQQAQVHEIYQAQLNKNGDVIVWASDGKDGTPSIYRAALSNMNTVVRITALALGKKAGEYEPQWSPDGKEIAFLSEAGKEGQSQIFVANAITGRLVTKKPLTKFDGYVSHLKWSPDGKYLSALYVEKASREPSPMAAKNKLIGLIDSLANKNIQRIAVVNRLSGQTIEVTPPELYIFEYDWSPDSKNFVYTAALPPGDDNWYIAQLYRQSIAAKDTVSLYHPLRQIALPRWSPDGKNIAFIEGLMSDQGGTGGEIFSMPASANTKPQNLTPDRRSTPSWFTWQPDGNILFTEFVGGSVAINTLNVVDEKIARLWKGDESIHGGNEQMSVSIGGTPADRVFAFIRTSWNSLPEVWGGKLDKLQQLTKLNVANKHLKPVSANTEWVNEDQAVQGWLLYPEDFNPSKKYPMLVAVHGGPAWITTPAWSAPDFNTTVYTKLGYFVFFPNPRGSYGQGEKFTLANRRDWGFGDLQDITSGVDAVIKKFPVDSNRVGILGWSYGGSMSMFAITQTNKFRAAVAGAGAADWLSYYGQNSIDKWMWSYFGASPYDDPVAYAKASAMTHIKSAKTPTLVLVGELDGEAPPPQSLQFWHALKELHVPTQLMIYPDEGHSFYKFDDMIDISVRTYEWFNKYMTP
jgi:dipeptidyl aminopeptidase/acylaminoacyl peptidase